MAEASTPGNTGSGSRPQPGVLKTMVAPFLPLALAVTLGSWCGFSTARPLTQPPPPPQASASAPDTNRFSDGKLQLHFMDVGQGDGAVLISPGGEVVLFDDGVRNHCDRPVSYLQQLGITKVDYHIASHYHDDHIGLCIRSVRRIPTAKTRG